MVIRQLQNYFLRVGHMLISWMRYYDNMFWHYQHLKPSPELTVITLRIEIWVKQSDFTLTL